MVSEKCLCTWWKEDIIVEVKMNEYTAHLADSAELEGGSDYVTEATYAT
jgi:hypothetical protein